MRQLGFDSEFSINSGHHDHLVHQTSNEINISRDPFTAVNTAPSRIKPDSTPASSHCFQGSLTELRVGDVNPINPGLLIPLLANVAHEQRWLMWLSHQSINKNQWAQHLNHTELPIMHMTTNIQSQWLLALRAASSGNHHVCVEWQGEMSVEQQEVLRTAAEKAGSHLFIITRQH